MSSNENMAGIDEESYSEGMGIGDAGDLRKKKRGGERRESHQADKHSVSNASIWSRADVGFPGEK